MVPGFKAIDARTAWRSLVGRRRLIVATFSQRYSAIRTIRSPPSGNFTSFHRSDKAIGFDD
jgi:hypothetical protein